MLDKTFLEIKVECLNMIKEKTYLTREDMIELDKKLKLIPITFDYMFKGIFIDDLDLLKDFILSQLDININPKECKIRLLNNELPKENKKEYKKSVDLYVAIDNNIFVEIEINREPFEDVKLRNYLYSDKLYTLLLEQGEDIGELKNKKFIQINLNAKEKNIMYGEEIIVPYGLKSKQVYIDNKYTILKFLEYYRNLFYNGVRLSYSEMWLVSFTARNFTELYDLTGYIMNDEKRDKYLRKVIKLSKDNFILHEWQKEKMEALVESERRRNALREGREQGVEQTQVEFVTNMLKKNLDIELISEISKLSEEEIMKIKESL